jgi:hypothetical protein|tara:strand:- start:620 stop:793 length:174 start_codon:yes stop_codon:yes gene_type:complete
MSTIQRRKKMSSTDKKILKRSELEDLIQKFVTEHNLDAQWGKEYEGVCSINFSVDDE